MNRLRMLLMGTALVVAGSALASAQPRDDDHRGDRRDGRVEQRDHDRGRDRDRDRHFDRDRRFDRDRDFDRGRHFDRDDRRFVDRRYYYDRDYRYVPNYYSYRVGERRFFNGYYWAWDGSRWCRRDHGVSVYFNF
jgi:hypothetical protein